MTPRALLLILTLWAAQALAAGVPQIDEPWPSGPERASWVETLKADSSLSDSTLKLGLESSDWRVRQQSALLLGWRSKPELYARFQTESPLATRAGIPRFRGEELGDPSLAPLMLERLLQGTEPENELALIELLPRTGGDWAQAFVELGPKHQDPRVRGVMVASLRWAPTEPALTGMRAAMRDAEPSVRAEAARAAGWHVDGAALATELTRALRDGDAEVREMAARSLGYRRVKSAFDALIPLLSDPAAGVRLQSLHALERLDASRLSALRELESLRSDPDPKVARAAEKL